jgi:hypothetical protein
MTKWQKIPLGVVCLSAGGALLLWNGAAIVLSLTQAKTGIPLLNLAGCIGGLFGIGGAADLLGAARGAAKPKEAVALSIWASRAHVDQWSIGEN